MNATAASPVTVSPGRALWQQAAPRVRRGLLFMVVLTLGIALLLTVMDAGKGFLPKLVYSTCIGFTCWLLIDGVRMAGAAGWQLWRHHRGLPLADDPMAIRWLAFMPVVLIGVAAGPALGVRLADALLGATSPPLWHWASPVSRVTLFITVLATAISVTVIWLQERVASARAQAEAARRAQTEAQLRLLQSQLEPHMLFNTLANLRVLIGLDAERAQQMLDRLIAYLRATLQASRRERHPLRDEFARLSDYLELMQVRMGPRLRVHIHLPTACAEVPVPPLILQPLVENSIQHGLEPKVSGGELTIRAQVDHGQLRLEVADTGVGLGSAPPSQGTQFGLEQVRSRLSTLYGTRASLLLQAGVDGTGALATLTLPLDTR
ncbi:MAG: histidine kinase [Rubrivivax sp.]|jgi:sensor histidine kinase YesM|nr:histidine kinase [Rubrivivax sp.]